MDQGKINQKTKEREPLSVRSVRSYKSILNAVFKQAMIDGVVKSNPVDHLTVSGKKNRDYNEEMLFLTETEISDFLHFLRDNFPRLLGIAFMGVYYGLRRSEILGLKWSAIDFDKKIIHICDTVVRVKTTQANHSTKTPAGRRNLNLFETAENCLLLIKQEQANNKAFLKGITKTRTAMSSHGKTVLPTDQTTYPLLSRKPQPLLEGQRSPCTNSGTPVPPC